MDGDPDSTSDLRPATSRWRGFQAADLDEAREHCERFFYPMILEPVGSLGRFAMSFHAAQVGAVTVGIVHYNADLRVTADDLVTGYNVALPLAGRMVSTHRGVSVRAGTDRAVVYQPAGTSVVDPLRADCRLLSIKIDRVALENQLQEVTGREITRPVAMAPSMDVTTGPGRSWTRLAALLTNDLLGSDGLTANPLVAARLADTLIGG